MNSREGGNRRKPAVDVFPIGQTKETESPPNGGSSACIVVVCRCCGDFRCPSFSDHTAPYSVALQHR